MAKSFEVMQMLCPAGGWILYGDDFDGMTWVDNRPRCTKAEFEAGFAQYDAWKTQQDLQTKTNKLTAQTKLAALGLTAEDLTALGL
jgi:hypothetical protein